MLYIVLVLVLAAFGLLVAALTTANTLWAWLSVLISVAAAGLLVFDWLGARRRRAAAAGSGHGDPPSRRDAVEDDLDGDHPRGDHPEGDHADDADARARDTPPEGEVPAAASTAVGGEAVGESGPSDDPAEEATDAADLLIVSGLSVDVRVLDERPRYHLGRCAVVTGRPSIGLPVAEARQLGFTPCARCTPDAVLAERHRAGRGAKQPKTDHA